MFYQPENGHGLPHNPFKAIVAPRPIAWVSTQDQAGVANLAPYSFFNAIADAPPQVMFASTGRKPDQPESKDSLSNIRETGVFCINIVSKGLQDAMNASSAPAGKDVDEFELAGLTKANCDTITCPRVDEAPAALECRLNQIIRLDGDDNYLVLGHVTGVHIKDEVLNDGVLDVTRYQPLARLGYRDYSAVESVFSLTRPKA
ncbi:MAG: flavin reductase family protein [Cognatishimia sp.]|uniref:flavin reductase family protein n=1 Tax=Cognatishimia sp. TaxID=2211648 RepID=UPI003B8AC2D1